MEKAPDQLEVTDVIFTKSPLKIHFPARSWGCHGENQRVDWSDNERSREGGVPKATGLSATGAGLRLDIQMLVFHRWVGFSPLCVRFKKCPQLACTRLLVSKSSHWDLYTNVCLTSWTRQMTATGLGLSYSLPWWWDARSMSDFCSNMGDHHYTH